MKQATNHFTDPAKDLIRHHSQDCFQADPGAEQPQQAAGQSAEQAFRDQLAEDAESARPERRMPSASESVAVTVNPRRSARSRIQ